MTIDSNPAGPPFENPNTHNRLVVGSIPTEPTSA